MRQLGFFMAVVYHLGFFIASCLWYSASKLWLRWMSLAFLSVTLIKKAIFVASDLMKADKINIANNSFNLWFILMLPRIGVNKLWTHNVLRAFYLDSFMWSHNTCDLVIVLTELIDYKAFWVTRRWLVSSTIDLLLTSLDG